MTLQRSDRASPLTGKRFSRDLHLLAEQSPTTPERIKGERLPEPVLSEEDIDRFWRKVDRRGETGCWNWPSQSYGTFSVGSLDYKAPAISLLLHTGRWPEAFVLHSCDNPRCVNPAHLFEGTAKDNTEDMIRKRRNGHGRHGRSLYRKPRNADASL